MDPVTNRLILKANRSLGSQLAQARLVTIEHLDAANETFIARLREGIPRDASLLRILIYDLQVLNETALIGHVFENAHIGGFNLDAYQVQDEVMSGISMAECVATWTLPVDFWHGVTVLATAYHLSDFVRGFWKDRIDGPISWLVCPYSQLDSWFERKEAEEAEEAAAIPIA